ncbi:MAG: mechanosensitive ion channel family protein [Bacilli bacterium]
MKKFFDIYLGKFISVGLIIVITLGVNYLVDKMINKVIKKKNKKNITTLLILVKRIKTVILYILGALICLSKFDAFNSFSVTLLSGLGIGSVVIGLAAQESLGNLFSSIAIVLGNPFEVGDYVKCVDNQVAGTVEDITMRHTIIKTINNKRIIIPNSVMNKYALENYNYKDNEIVKPIEFPISYNADMDKAINIIKEEMKKLYAPSKTGKNSDVEFPLVKVSEWKDSAIMLKAWVWGKDNSNVYDNIFELNYIIKKRFDQEKIEIPYQHINVIVDKK